MKRWIRQRLTSKVNQINSDLHQQLSLREYWNKLKRFVNLNKPSRGIPIQATVHGVIVSGPQVLQVWQQAFAALGSANFGEALFDANFTSEVHNEVKANLTSSLQNMELITELDGPITQQEIHTSVQALSCGKACGLDGIVTELLKYGGAMMEQSLLSLFQFIFESEKFPIEWVRGVIFPLHKEGDERNPDNYRGITLLSVVGKLYSAILTKRITNWCEQNGAISEEQAGFRPNRSTSDQVFTLFQILQQRKEAKQETVCVFLDIKKAYDTAFRDGIWKRLYEVGIKGKLWRVIRNIYQLVQSCVQLGAHFTEWFVIELGLRQGDPLSAILYIIFIDGLVKRVKQANIGVSIGELLLALLMFADDVALLAGTRKEMQQLLDVVFSYSREWRFLWSVVKSKSMTFTNKRVRRVVAPLYLGLDRLEEVTQFRYLGVELSANLSWAKMKEKVLKKARSRLYLLSNAMKGGLAPDASLKLWFTLIRPLLEYGVALWGLHRSTSQWQGAECVQNQMGRLILGVHSKTASDVVRGELGLWTVTGRVKLAMLKWWGKMVLMNPNRLCSKVYRIRKNEIKDNRPSWCLTVRDILVDLGSGDVWESEQVGTLAEWYATATRLVRASEITNWRNRMLNHPKLRLYRQWKQELVFEDYLTQIPEFRYRRELSRIRSGTTKLRLEVGRWSKIDEEQRLCTICGGRGIENEQHVLFECWVYSDLRSKMFSSIRNQTGDTYQLSRSWDDRDWLLNMLIGPSVKDQHHRKVFRMVVSKYLYKAMKTRSRLLE